LKLIVVRDLYSLKDKWNVLLNKSLENNIFMTWEWIITWWKHFGKGREPLILVVRENNKILAIAPLMVSRYKIPFFGNLRKIEFIGTPDSDYHDFIILKKERKCLKYFLNFLKTNIEIWDWIDLKEIPKTSVSTKVLSSEIIKDLKINKRICNICPYVKIPDSTEGLMKNLSKNMRGSLRRCIKKLTKKYNINFEKYSKIGSIQKAMKTFIALNKKRWKQKNTVGIYDKQMGKKFVDFHIDISKIFAKKGWLGLYFLTANGVPISAQFTFEYRKKMYYYLAGFDPDYSSYSVGNIITKFLLEECQRKGLKEYDMLRGNEPYKYRWATNIRENLAIRLVKMDFFSNLCDWITSNKTLRDNILPGLFNQHLDTAL